MALGGRASKMDPMQSALTTPVMKSIALAGLALGLGVAASSLLSPDHVTHRLKLHATDVPGYVYVTVFREGDIRVRFDGDEIYPFKVKTYARYAGCRVLGIETLVPRDARSFDYDYSERILGCDPGSPGLVVTPRKGVVTIED